MNDFVNSQSRNRPMGAINSLDGFTRTPRSGIQRKAQSSNSSFALPSASPKLDDFKRPDGLRPSSPNRSLNTDVTAAPALTALPVVKSRTFNFEKPVIIDKKPKNSRLRFWKNWSRRRRITTVVIALLVVGGGVFGAMAYSNVFKVLKGGGGAAALEANVDPSKLKGEGDGRVNILLMGRGGEGYEGADLTDTIIIASIDPIAKEASLLSIPRDLYVPVNKYGSMKINAVFSTGKTSYESQNRNADKKKAEEAGYQLVQKTIEKNLGVPIHYYSMIDFSGFRQAIDTVGGVEVDVKNPVAEQMRIDGKPYKLDVKPGRQEMDGLKALAYSRSRYTSARGDFDRSERQRELILALKNKTLSAGTISNPAKISGLLNNLGDRVSSSFSLNDLTRLYELSKEIDSSKIKSIGLADPPNNYVQTAAIGNQSVVIPTAGKGNYGAIQGYLRNVLKDSFIKNENANIAVYNGTNSVGFAGRKGEDLKSYGYNITTIANAPTKGYTRTVLIDMRGGQKKYTKSYLEKRLGVTAVSNIPDPAIQAGTADFVIILGTDLADAE